MAKKLVGTVVSTKMTKTVVVEVERKFRHPVYHKIRIKNKKYLAQNDKLELVVGDWVTIQECRPLSKNKHFTVINKLAVK
jgi:small subunit ribosomal protein S17